MAKRRDPPAGASEFARAVEIISTSVPSMTDLPSLYDLAATMAHRTLPVEGAAVYVPHAMGYRLAAVAGRGGVVGAVLPASPTDPVSRAAEFRIPVWSDARDLLALPVEAGPAVEAVLALRVEPGEAGPLVGDVLVLANVLVHQVGVALVNIRARERAELERARYEAVVEYAQDGILVRRGGVVAFANRAARTMIAGLQIPITVQDFFEKHVHADDHPLIHEKYRERLAGKRGRQHYEVRFLRPDGTAFPVLLDSMDIPFDGEQSSLIFFRDLTEIKEAEAALRERTAQLVQADKLAAIGVLAAGVAHDINNPLAFMRSSLELVREDLPALREALPEGERHHANDLEDALTTSMRGLDRIAKIVQSLRQFSKPAPERRETDLNAVSDTAMLFATNHIRAKSVRVRTEYAHDIPRILANETQLGQVVLNLILNAVDAVPDRGGVLTVRTRRENGGLVLEVEDNGHGIPDAAKPRIFTNFYTTKKAGTGIGLIMSRHIVKEHGGSLTFESWEGKGTVFRMELPLT